MEGNTINSSTIKAETMKAYISAAVKLFLDEGILDPTFDPISKRRCPMITNILLEQARWETMADRRNPVTWPMVEYQQSFAQKDDFLSFD